MSHVSKKNSKKEKMIQQPEAITARKGEVDRETFFNTLRSGKTIRELQEKFRLTEEEIKNLFNNPPKENKIYRDDTLPGVNRYYCIPSLKVRSGKRIWAPFLEKNCGPAVDIVFPDNIGWTKEKINGQDRKQEKMRIVPLADIWYGHELCDEASFEERINWIAKEPHVFCFLNGDCIHPQSINTKSKQIAWNKLCDRFYELLESIAHKILWAQAGCFEDRMNDYYYDPIESFCRFDHSIPYFRTPVSVGIHWAGNLFKFYCIHGKSQAQKKGSKINALLNILHEVTFNNFFVMSHVKDSISVKPTRVVESIETFDLVEKTQYAFITPSFVKYDGSRDSKWGYPLPARGQVNCALYRDGGYFLYSSSPTTNLEPYNANEEGKNGKAKK